MKIKFISFFTFVLISSFSLKVSAQCASCVADTTCTGPTGAVCPLVLPDANAGTAYDETVTFYMLPGFEIPGTGFGLEVNNVDATVVGMPEGLNYTLSASQFDPEVNDLASQYGCFKICGIPCAGSGTYTIRLLLDYSSSPAGIPFPLNLQVPFDIELTVNAPYEELEILSTSKYLCPGGLVTLSANDSHSGYDWSNGGTSMSTQANAVGTYVLQVSDTINNNVCLLTDTIEIMEFAPDAGSDIAICRGEITQLTGSGSDFYTWSPGAFLADSTVANPVVLYLDSTTTFTLTGYNDSCSSTEQVTITVDQNCPRVCQECQIDQNCTGTTGAVCPDVLPVATASQPYTASFSFYFPYEFDFASQLPIPIPIPGGFNNITIEYVRIDNISQLPSGLDWESDQSAAGDIYYPGLVEGVTGRGCISICGDVGCVPAGTYDLQMVAWLGLNGIPASLQGVLDFLPQFNNGEFQLPVPLTMQVVYDNPLTVSPSGPINLDFGDSVTLTASSTGLTDHEWSTGETGTSITVSEEGLYSVSAFDGTCTQTVEILVQVADPVGIEELGIDKLNIYPNPTSSSFEVSWASNTPVEYIRIYDMQGKLLFQEQLLSNIEQKSLNIESWASGLYFIELKNEKGSIQRKLIKQ